ncbi:MAG: hypothetical protein ACK5YR_23170 [Pirellula sp.]|jgi:hypothetical protein
MIKLRTISIPFVMVSVFNFGFLYGQGGPAVVDCVKLVNKSCGNMFGAWPGAPVGGTNCSEIVCATETQCSIGEPLALFWNANQEQWDLKRWFHIGVGTGEPGQSMSNVFTVFTCGYIDVCEYECVYNPVFNTWRCKTASRLWSRLYGYQNDLGPCGGPIE